MQVLAFIVYHYLHLCIVLGLLALAAYLLLRRRRVWLPMLLFFGCVCLLIPVVCKVLLFLIHILRLIFFRG